MKVAEIMTRNVRIADPQQPIRAIAEMMASDDIGFLPVGENDRLVGTITDRDMVIRAVARGLDPECRVRDVMTTDLKYCFDDDDVEKVVKNMGDIQVRRMPVINHDKRLVGVITLADAALHEDPEIAGAALSEVVHPGGQHNQSRH
ncbi:inosine-5-monophosphate dehydrogenase [Sphingomonas oleivorans]|uniref:Inosine-5-monophosphate dehydrogenase n=1 Tax=Sphingomonas oleivorans TaxID=1735121 RepID=A0A2T5G2B0_9SPHN|nr:CBS domain-containing protein [Sphingomonas oleivorans]PTQ13285.1 inosine-5-monophosphate dehydrogenase [Sphingomonas oleivorans]